MPYNTGPSFAIGGGGKAFVPIGTTPVFFSRTAAHSLAMQADGSFVIGGVADNGGNSQDQNHDYDFALVRYRADGTLDTSFGDGGKVVTPGAGMDTGYGVIVQADGKILLGGTIAGDFGIARYNIDGSLDTSFGGGDGKVTTPVGLSVDEGKALVVLPGGKILLVGDTSSYPPADSDITLVQYNSDGSLDTTFGSGGKVRTLDSANVDRAESMAIQSDGKIIVVGDSLRVGVVTNNTKLFLARYNTDGTLDGSFGTNGIVRTTFGNGNHANSVVMQPDGKIIVAGFRNSTSSNEFLIARYNEDGTIDASFSSDGFLTIEVSGRKAIGESVILQPDGKIIIAGVALLADGHSTYDFGLIRLNQDGSLDATFGQGGQVTTEIYGNDEASSVILQPDGKIVVAGASDGGFSIVRYNSNGSLDSSFGGTTTLDGHPTFTEGGAAVVLDSNVTIADAELSAGGSYAGASLTLERAGGASSDDVFGASGTLSALTQGGALVVGGTTIGTVTQNSGGTLVLTFGAGATQALVNEVLRKITYANTDHTPPANVTIDWSFSDGNAGSQGTGGALATKGSTTVTIVPTDGGEAKDDAFTTDELTPVLGSVLDDNGSGADANLDGFTITAVNGVAAAVGKQITLASGALLTLNADGTFAYNPNGALEWVPAAGSGASNLTGSDSFTYELSKGSTATVTITASGVDNDDILQGVAGAADTLKGGAGDDQYVIRDASDLVVELTGNGFDRVGASTSYFLAAGVEIEVLTTTSAGSTAAINLTGNALAQTIMGNAGNNVLSDGGKGGSDTLVGLGGNDTFIVYNQGDVIVEASGSGTDRVAAGVDYKLAAGVSVELLNTTSVNGAASIDLTGNELAQKITGNAGDNILDDGGIGEGDVMAGLGGNDTYIVYNRADAIQEAIGGGNDHVKVSATFALTAGAEVETLSTLSFDEVRAINLVGNEFGQVLQGNAGVNALNGRGGNDVLTGGGGNDYFIFGTTLGAGNVDVISDFNATDDTIRLDNAIFKTLSVSATLVASAFRANASGTAEDADDRIIYETDTGKLYYDANGSAGGGVTHFATLTGNPTITNADFAVI